MPNYDGLYEVRIIYTTDVSNISLEHRHTVDVILDNDVSPGVDWGDVVVQNWDTTNQALQTMINEYVDLLAAAYEDTALFVRAELWKYDPEPSTDATFMTQVLLDVPGVSVSPTISAQQATMTFRSASGGIMRVQLMEVITNLNTKVPISGLGGVYEAIATFVAGNANAFAARDNSYPFAPLNVGFGQNEKLWRRRNRP